jgi:hypothetical protein
MRGVQPTAGGGRSADRVEGDRACLTWDAGKLMSGRLNRIRGWPRFPAACGSRTRGSNRPASGPPLSRGLCLTDFGQTEVGRREMHKWNIPDWLEREVKDCDRHCVYCRVEFGSTKETRKSIATWEHIVNDARIVNRENIARCCFSCNASKGTKKLPAWLESDYCKKRGITMDTVAEVVKRALVVRPNVPDEGA